MSVMDKKYINVLNCEENVEIVPTTNGRCYTFEPGSIDEPCVLPIPSEEVRYINSVSKCFKNGVLRFEADEAAEIYEELGIRDPDSIIFMEKIDEMLQNPTTEYMQRIIDIKESSQFERIRGRFYYLTNNGIDIPMKVGKIVEARYKEIIAGKLHSDIQVTPAKQDEAVDKARIKELEERSKTYDDTIAMLMARLAALEGKSEVTTSPLENEQKPVAEVKTEAAVKPKRGRVAKKADGAK